MAHKNHEARSVWPRYIIFTVDGTDILCAVYGKNRTHACPTREEVEKMQEAADKSRTRRSNPTPGEIVSDAVDSVAYGPHAFLYVGELCHVEL